MFEIGWSEIFVIVVVAIVVVGPKDLPRLLRTVGNMVGKVRRMSGDFQRQFNAALKEAEREADLEDTRKSLTDAQRTIGEVRRSMVNPLREMTPLKTGAAAAPAAATATPVSGPATTPAEPVLDPAAPETQTAAAAPAEVEQPR